MNIPPDSGYTELTLDHSVSPRNVGSIPEPDGIAVDRNPVCGDVLTLFLRIEDGRIQEAKQQVQGCTGATAAGSMLSELLQGMNLAKAEALTHQDVLDALGGLPPSKLHSATLAATVLRKALAVYARKNANKDTLPSDPTVE